MAICSTMINKVIRYNDFIRCIEHCNLCDKLCESTEKLSFLPGNVNSKVLIIDEFPNQKGNIGNDNLEMLINNAGWKKENIFITYALLCSSKGNSDISSLISPIEIENCTFYLQMIINLIHPEVIVTLGTLALDALNNINHYNLNLRDDAGKRIIWGDKVLVPLYSPKKDASMHRSIPKQRADFISLAKYVDPIKGIKVKKSYSSYNNNDDFTTYRITQIIYSVISSLKEMPYFKLIKLLYFIDLTALERLGQSLTGALYLRQQEGPWSPDLKKAISGMNGYEIQYINKKIPFVRIGNSPRVEPDIDETYQQIINDVIEKYGNMNNTAIKIAAYRSKPMRYVLEQEDLKRDMRKIPLLYKDKTVIDFDKRSL